MQHNFKLENIFNNNDNNNNNNNNKHIFKVPQGRNFRGAGSSQLCVLLIGLT